MTDVVCGVTLIGQDDSDQHYQNVTALIRGCPDLVGIYNVGGGTSPAQIFEPDNNRQTRFLKSVVTAMQQPNALPQLFLVSVTQPTPRKRLRAYLALLFWLEALEPICDLTSQAIPPS